MNKSLGYLASVSIALGLSCAPAAAKIITFQVPGEVITFVGGITSHGDVIGGINDRAGNHGFLRAADGTITTIDAPGASNTYPTSISDDGTIVGYYTIGSGKRFRGGFVRAPDGEFTEFQAPHGGRYTIPTAITSKGWIAGTGKKPGQSLSFFGFLENPSGHFSEFTSGDSFGVSCANSANTTAGRVHAGNQWHGFVRTKDGAFAQFDPDGSTDTEVSAINSSGVVIGTAQIAGVPEGFVRAADGTLSTFTGSEGARDTVAAAINKSGAIVGAYIDAKGFNHAYVRAPDGTITTIDVHEGSDQGLTGINDKGKAAGYVRLADKGAAGFIWTP